MNSPDERESSEPEAIHRGSFAEEQSAHSGPGESAPGSDSDSGHRAPSPQKSWRRNSARFGILAFLLWALVLDVRLPIPGFENSSWSRWFRAIEPYTPYAYSEQAEFQFHDVAFANELTGCGVSQSGTILWTDDGGVSWRPANEVTWLR